VLAVKLVALAAVTESDCDAGATPPAVALKVRDVGLRVMPFPVEACATVNLTPTVCLPCDVRREIVPLYVPTASPAGFTETVRSWFVYSMAEGEETLNQFALSR
jgi:hypothetical protein